MITKYSIHRLYICTPSLKFTNLVFSNETAIAMALHYRLFSASWIFDTVTDPEKQKASTDPL
jgi:hypothetical protein